MPSRHFILLIPFLIFASCKTASGSLLPSAAPRAGETPLVGVENSPSARPAASRALPAADASEPEAAALPPDAEEPWQNEYARLLAAEQAKDAGRFAGREELVQSVPLAAGEDAAATAYEEQPLVLPESYFYTEEPAAVAEEPLPAETPAEKPLVLPESYFYNEEPADEEITDEEEFLDEEPAVEELPAEEAAPDIEVLATEEVTPEPLENFFPETIAPAAVNINGTAFLRAAAAGDLPVVRTLLEQSREHLKETDDNGNTALHLAAYYGADKVAAYLLANNAAVNEVNNRNQTALDLTLTNYPLNYNHARVIRELITYRSQRPRYTRDFDYLLSVWPGNRYNIRFNGGNTAMHLAAFNGQFGIMELFIEEGMPWDKPNNLGDYPIHAAVRGGSPKAVDILVNAGASIETKNSNGSTPLHLAFDLPQPRAMVLYLLNKGADVNARNIYRNTPLIIAAITGQPVALARELVARAADVDAVNDTGSNALFIAMERENKELALYLLEHHADIMRVNRNNESPLSLALQQGMRTLTWFMDFVDIAATDKTGNTMLHVAAAVGAPADSVSYIIYKGAALNAQNSEGKTALQLAAEHNHAELAVLLADAGADPYIRDYQGNSAMDALMHSHYATALRFLKNLPARFRSDAAGNTPLFYAVHNRRNDLVSYLSNDKSQLNQINNEGKTVLHVAAALGDARIIDILVKAGADLNATDFKGNTPLHTAVILYNRAAVRELAALGADINTINNEGKSAFYLALENNDTEIINMLGDKARPNVNLRAYDGNTPLHVAVRQQNIGTVRYLLERGADRMLTDSSGRTPLDLARSYGNNALIRLLMQNF
jgi:ankyrin repeat protein